MAIELLGAGDDRLEFGDISGIAGLTDMTIAFTIKTTGTLTGERLMGQWESAGLAQAFLCQLVDTNEIGFVVSDGTDSVNFFGRKTTDSPIAVDSLLRVVCTVALGTPDVEIWVNGSIRADISWFSGSSASIVDSNKVVFVGHEAESSADGVDGDYSEIAIWNHKVPDWVAIAYGKGFSPAIYRSGGLLYCKAINTGFLIDEWGGNTVTNTGGANAVHPSIIYPYSPQIITAPAAAVAAIKLRTLTLLGAGI